MTGVATLCLQLLGEGEDKEARGGMKALKMISCDWDKPGIYSPLYGWYYITQAKFHQGGQTWSAWNNRFAGQYVRNQHEDGHWSFPTKETGSNQGDVYSTLSGIVNPNGLLPASAQLQAGGSQRRGRRYQWRCDDQYFLKTTIFCCG